MRDISEADYLKTLELLCEAALDTSAWLRLLRHLAGMTGATAGGLTAESPWTREGSPFVYFGFDESHVEKTFSYYLPQNPLFSIAPRMLPGAVITNGMVVPVDEFRRTEFYDGWARPQGLCCPVTVVLDRDDSHYFPLTLVRSDNAGDASPEHIGLLERLSPALRRAFRANRCLALKDQNASALDTALDHLAAAAILLDERGKITYASPAAERLATSRRGISFTRHRGIAASDRRVEGLLQAAIERALKQQPSQVLDVPLELCAERPLCATVMSLQREAAVRTFSRATNAVLILIRDSGGLSRVEAAMRMSALYGLTSAETRILGEILSGTGLVSAASKIGSTRATAQTHLQHIFAKTGTHRQGELIALAFSLASRAPRDCQSE